MNHPETFGLNAANSVLGILVLACLLIVFSAVLHDLASRVRRREQRRETAPRWETEDSEFLHSVGIADPEP